MKLHLVLENKSYKPIGEETFSFSWISNGNEFNANLNRRWLSQSFDSSTYDFYVGDVNDDGRVDIIGISFENEKTFVWLSQYSKL